jgi:hypothetical protein
LRFDFVALVLFVVGALRIFELQLQASRNSGFVYATDLATVALLPFAFLKIRRIRTHPRAGLILIAVALWFAFAVVTDLYRDVRPEDFLRGWAKIAMFGTTLFVLVALTDLRVGRLAAYFSGLATAVVLIVLIRPDPWQVGEPWKFGLGLCGGVLASAFAAFGPKLIPIIPKPIFQLPMLGLAAICLVSNARSMFGTLAISSFLCIAFPILGSLLRQLRTNVARWLVIGTLGVVVATGSIALYSGLAAGGVLGADAQQKYFDQTGGGSSNIFVGGRPESIVAFQAIADSPLIGHGSWAKDTEYRIMLVSMSHLRGIPAIYDPRAGMDIPSHSYFTQAWVEHGVGGALFWLIVVFTSIQSVMRALRSQPDEAPIYVYSLFTLLWAIFFSPFGQDTRFFAAAEICLILWAFGLTTRSSAGSPQAWMTKQSSGAVTQ